jgi:SAM-dependent methyltransferase
VGEYPLSDSRADGVVRRGGVAQNAVMATDAERIIGLYRRHARAWAMARGGRPGNRVMEADWLDRFRSLLPCFPTVLDIGCGSGEPMGRYLIEQGCSLMGVDSAPEMIAMCESPCLSRHGA